MVGGVTLYAKLMDVPVVTSRGLLFLDSFSFLVGLFYDQ